MPSRCAAPRSPLSRVAPRLAAALVAALLAGCKVNPDAPSGTLTPADFVARGQAGTAPPPPAPTPTPEEEGPPAPEPTDTATVTPEAAREGLRDLTLRPGPPDDSHGPAIGMEAPHIVDAMVGSIGGRPIYAAEFLGPMEARLRAKADEEGITKARWQDFAAEQIGKDLFTLMRDELMTAEARRELKPEQKASVFNFVNEIMEQQRRMSGGSAAQAAGALQSGGETEEDFRRRQEIAILLNFKFDQIRNRAIVPWRDIKAFHENNPKKFRPPPTARFRLIQVPAADAEAVARVKQALAGGTPFEDVARSKDNRNKPDQGGLETRTVVGEYGKVDFFGRAELNQAAWGLTEGGAPSDAVEVSGQITWVYLEKIERINRPLTEREVQLSIADELTARKFDEELRKYVTRLLERARYSGWQDIIIRLVELATDWYWPPGKP